MVEMAKANGANIYQYLNYLLEKLPNDRMSDEELELLASWNENVKAEIKRLTNDRNQSYVKIVKMLRLLKSSRIFFYQRLKIER